MEVKVYRIEGEMLISPDSYPRWQKFIVDVRALKPEHAVERVYSELGSRHKLKRGHIKIKKVYEISVEETKNPQILRLSKLERVIV